MSTDTPALTKHQKAFPAPLLKQLRATAAVMCLDYCLNLNTMSTPELQKRLYNMYHGNEDLNIVSQVDLLYNGKSNYASMYRHAESTNLDNNVKPKEIEDSPGTKILVSSIHGYEDAIDYKSDIHFDLRMILSPSKTKLKDKCSGRFLWDLSRAAICNIKKAAIIADEWLVNNDTPSGTNWEDLYHHLLTSYPHEIGRASCR